MGRKGREDEIKLEALSNKCSALKSDCELLQRENSILRKRVSELERQEKELMRWRAKEKMIVRHLRAVKNVVK